MFLKDFKVAKEYYEKTAIIEGAPSQTKRLAANAAFKMMDYEIREPKEKLSSYILGKNNLLYPIGIGGVNSKTLNP